ncbi:hypothetical protein V5F59_17870 [Xanthobacter autotrophicus DSM 431]|uniref:hypothetical protein n=1 Tax=Xanthobacter nonsaccharivorans TaxID=3119912 RepID=UPI00372AD507
MSQDRAHFGDKPSTSIFALPPTRWWKHGRKSRGLLSIFVRCDNGILCIALS